MSTLYFKIQVVKFFVNYKRKCCNCRYISKFETRENYHRDVKNWDFMANEIEENKLANNV